MKRSAAIVSLVLAALAGLAAIAASRVASSSFYSDGRTLREPAAAARPRSILWLPATPVATSHAGADVGATAEATTDATNTPDEYEPRLSADGTRMILVRGRPGANADLFERRWTPAGWTAPEPIASINSPADELGPELSADGQRLYFYSDRDGTIGGFDLWVAHQLDNAWGAPVNLGPCINSTANDYGPALAPDGGRLYFASNRSRAGEPPRDDAWSATIRERRDRHDYDLFFADLEAGSEATRLDALNTPSDEGAPALSPAADFLYFASDRPGGLGGFDLYRTRLRDGIPDSPTPLDASVNSAANDLDPALSAEGFRLFFSSDRPLSVPGAQTTNPAADRAVNTQTPSARSAASQNPPVYSLWTSASREVFLDRDPLTLGDALAQLWHDAWPWILALLLMLLALVGAFFLARHPDLRDRYSRLGLLARCLLASLLVHMLLLSLLGFWHVGSAIGDILAHPGGHRVSLASSASLSDSTSESGSGDSLFNQIMASAIEPSSVAPAADPQSSAITPVRPLDASPASLTIARAAPQLAPTTLDSPEAAPTASPAAPTSGPPPDALAQRLPPTSAPDAPVTEAQTPTPMLSAAPSATNLTARTLIATSSPLAVPATTETQPATPQSFAFVDAPAPAPSAASSSSLPPSPAPLVATLPTAPAASAALETPPATRLPGIADPSAIPVRSLADFASASNSPSIPRASATGIPALSTSPAEAVPSASQVARADIASPLAASSLQSRVPTSAAAQPTSESAAAASPVPMNVPAGAAPQSLQLPGRAERTLSALPLPSSAPATPSASAASSTASSIADATASASFASPSAAPLASAVPLGTRLPEVALPRAGITSESTAAPSTAPSIGSAAALRSTPAPLAHSSTNSSRVASAVPSLPASVINAPPSAGPSAALSDVVRGVSSPSRLADSPPPLAASPRLLALEPDPPAPSPADLALRDPAIREQVLESTGGSRETERAVSDALAWLARHQSHDGRFSGQDFDDDCNACGSPAEVRSDTAMTGLALLAFLGAGHIHTAEGTHQDAVARALGFLIAGQSADGDLRRGETLYSQSVATVALCEAYAMSKDARVGDAARRALRFLEDRSARPSSDPADTGVLGWQLMAVHSARRCGFATSNLTLDRARRWLAQIDRGLGRFAYTRDGEPSPAATAEVMVVSQLLGHRRDEPAMKAAAEFILTAPPAWNGRAPTYYWYYATLALFQQQGEAWKAWNDRLAPELLEGQHRDGPAKGSWNPQDQWSRLGGRIYQTAVCTLSLEIYYRYSPVGLDLIPEPRNAER
ncbi:MAG: hypothetical protein ACKVW3_07660 [Phycisphaerales bacterium]